MRFSPLFKAAFLLFSIPFSSLATSIAITTASIDFTSMKTTLIFEGTPQVIFDDYMFSASGSFDGGSGEGNYYEFTPNSQVFASLSDENGLSFFTTLQSIDESAETRSVDLRFYRNFDVVNLKGINIEYDWNALVYLNTDTYGDYVFEETESWAALVGPEGLSTFYSQSVDLDARNGSDNFSNFQGHVQLDYIYDSPVSGSFSFYGGLAHYTGVYGYSSVPENATASLILPGLVCLFGFALYDRKRSIYRK